VDFATATPDRPKKAADTLAPVRVDTPLTMEAFVPRHNIRLAIRFEY
jgi:hypothetical protein